jgi:hypothetical protein
MPRNPRKNAVKSSKASANPHSRRKLISKRELIEALFTIALVSSCGVRPRLKVRIPRRSDI